MKDKLKYNYLKKHLSAKQFSKYLCEIKSNYITLDYINVEEVNNYQELMKAFKSKEEFILVNSQIAKILCNNFNEEEALINYEINEKNLILNLKSKSKALFRRNLNIININSFIEVEIGIEGMLNSIIEYYKFQKLIIKELKENNNQNMKEGYLIDEKWFKEWKKYSNYENIKNNFKSLDELSDNNVERIKDFINKDFIKNKFEINTLTFKDSVSFSNSLKNKTFILVSEEFALSLLSKSFNQIKNRIKFSLKNREITFYFANSNIKYDKYIIDSFNNIISLNMKLSFNMINILVNLHIFRKNLEIMKEKSYEIKNNSIEIELIDKKFINIIKELYNYEELRQLIDNLEIYGINENNGNLINEIPESYFDTIYNKIYLNDGYKKLESITNNSFFIELKKLKNQNISYLDDFELINKNAIDYLICLNKENISKISKDAICLIEKENILIKYKNDKNIFTYCIGYINIDNSFISKYLILSFNNLLEEYKIFEKNGINYLLNELKINKDGYYDIQSIIGHCYELKPNEDNMNNKNQIKNLDKFIVNNKNKNEIKNLDAFIKVKNNKKELNPSIKEDILAIIQIYLFNYDLKKNFASKSKILDNCYIINKEWILEYKKYYLYDELSNYLNYNNYIDKLDLQKNDRGNIFNENNALCIYKDIKEKSKFFNIYYQKDIKIIDKNLLQLKKQKIENINKEIVYINDFVIINKEIYNKLINNKYNSFNQEEKEYIINKGYLIIKFDEEPYQILIGKLNTLNDECNIIPFLLLNFKTISDLIDHYEELPTFNFNEYMKILSFNNYKIIKDIYEIGEAFLLNNKSKNNIENKNNENLKIIHNCSFNYKQEYITQYVNKKKYQILMENLELINSQKEEIEKLKEELKKSKMIIDEYNKCENKVIPYDQIMCVNFTSTDHQINYGVPCTNNDIFAEVEEKLYKVYPELRETNNNFLVKGAIVLKFKTISENNIRNGDKVMIIIENEEE